MIFNFLVTHKTKENTKRQNAEKHLQESIKRAREAGVPEDKIIHTYEEGEAFFMS